MLLEVLTCGGGVLESLALVSSDVTDSDPTATSRSPSLTPLVSASLPGFTRLMTNEAVTGDTWNGNDDVEEITPSTPGALAELM